MDSPPTAVGVARSGPPTLAGPPGGSPGLISRAARCWLLVVALSGSSVQAQFGSEPYPLEAGEREREWTEYERDRQLEFAYEGRRARAHARLGGAASSVESKVSCPVLAGPAAPRNPNCRETPLLLEGPDGLVDAVDAVNPDAAIKIPPASRLAFRTDTGPAGALARLPCHGLATRRRNSHWNSM